VIVLNHVLIIMEVVAAAAAVAVSVVIEVAVAVVVAEVIVTDARNQVILHVIALNPIHAADKAVVHQINKEAMMMEINKNLCYNPLIIKWKTLHKSIKLNFLS